MLNYNMVKTAKSKRVRRPIKKIRIDLKPPIMSRGSAQPTLAEVISKRRLQQRLASVEPSFQTESIPRSRGFYRLFEDDKRIREEEQTKIKLEKLDKEFAAFLLEEKIKDQAKLTKDKERVKNFGLNVFAPKDMAFSTVDQNKLALKYPTPQTFRQALKSVYDDIKATNLDSSIIDKPDELAKELLSVNPLIFGGKPFVSTVNRDVESREQPAPKFLNFKDYTLGSLRSQSARLPEIGDNIVFSLRDLPDTIENVTTEDEIATGISRRRSTPADLMLNPIPSPGQTGSSFKILPVRPGQTVEEQNRRRMINRINIENATRIDRAIGLDAVADSIPLAINMVDQGSGPLDVVYQGTEPEQML